MEVIVDDPKHAARGSPGCWSVYAVQDFEQIMESVPRIVLGFSVAIAHCDLRNLEVYSSLMCGRVEDALNCQAFENAALQLLEAPAPPRNRSLR